MLTFDAWVFPDGETHIPEWMTREDHRIDGRLSYQYGKYEAALNLCQRRRTAVDVGAHVGLWSYWMARDFRAVHAFEPAADHRACWQQNLMSWPMKATLYPVALGADAGMVGIDTDDPASSGNAHVSTNGTPPTVERRTLDSYTIKHVDLLKIDCEGYEYFVVSGALDTIRRCRPVVVVEQKLGFGPRYGRGDIDAVMLLTDLGAKVFANVGGDYILTCEAVA